jgi:hypothetical protein
MTVPQAFYPNFGHIFTKTRDSDVSENPGPNHVPTTRIIMSPYIHTLVPTLLIIPRQ